MIDNDLTDITVVGGGIVGICCALALVESGAKVLLIDRDEPGQGASYGNAGVISPWSLIPQSVPGLWKNIPEWLLRSDGPIAIKPAYLLRMLPWGIRFLLQGRIARLRDVSSAMKVMNHDNIDLYRNLLKGTGHEDLIRSSYYVHAYRQAKKADLNLIEYAIRREQGAQLEKIGAADLKKLEPALSDDFKAAILIKGQARTISPGKVGQILAEKYLQLGGRFLKTEVEAIQKPADSSWLIKTRQADLSSKQVVIALGAWSGRLLKPLGIDIPLEAERGYHLEYSHPGIELNHSVMDMDLKVVASSMTGGLRAAGTAEFAGLDAPPSYRRIESLNKTVKTMLPGLNTKSSSGWMGIRPSMPDSLPCLGEISGHPGLYAAFGHSHFGFMMAPKTGKIIAELVLGKPPGIDLTPYRLERFCH